MSHASPSLRPSPLRTHRPGFAALSTVLVAALLGASPVTRGAELKLIGNEVNARLGESVALGTTLLTTNILAVGAPAGDHCAGGHGTGRVELFELDGATWGAVDCLSQGTIGAFGVYGEFGAAVAASGDEIMVGIPGRDAFASTPEGAFELFERTIDGAGEVTYVSFHEWGDGLTPYSDLGISVSTDGQRWMAGGSCTLPPAFEPGVAVIEKLNVGAGELGPPGGDSAEKFGAAVQVNGDYAIVGAPGDTRLGANTGSAFVYHRGAGETWTLQQKLTASDGATQHQFGAAVGIWDQFAVVGAPGWSSGHGKLYFYRRSGTIWSLDYSFAPPAAEGVWQLGATVAQAFTKVVASAPFSRVGVQEEAGRVFAFSWNPTSSSWVYEGSRAASDSGDYLWWGKALAVHQFTVAVGSPRDIDGGSFAGAVYVYAWEDIAGHLFSDGFEIGNADRWDSVQP